MIQTSSSNKKLKPMICLGVFGKRKGKVCRLQFTVLVNDVGFENYIMRLHECSRYSNTARPS